MDILKIKNEQGEWVSIPAIQGPPGTSADIKGVTQAEYDAMTEEKRKGFIVITDSPSASFEGEKYSTEEQRIGTWIDGKPLYRKVIQTNSGTSTSKWQKIYEFPTSLYLISAYGVLYRTAHPPQIPIPLADCNLGFDNNAIYTFINSGYMVNQPIIIIMTYTEVE